MVIQPLLFLLKRHHKVRWSEPSIIPDKRTGKPESINLIINDGLSLLGTSQSGPFCETPPVDALKISFFISGAWWLRVEALREGAFTRAGAGGAYLVAVRVVAGSGPARCGLQIFGQEIGLWLRRRPVAGSRGPSA